MRKRTRFIYGFFAGFAMLVIILDAKCATTSATEGLTLCIRAVIPSLFPFFVLSGILNSCLIGQSPRFLRPIGKICKLPCGCESLFLIGILAGYPVGAQLITQAYKSGSISKSTAHRMLGFCSNAGPAFVFGMLSSLFSDPLTAWLIWGIHIVSAVIVGFLLPKGEAGDSVIIQAELISLPAALQNGIKNMAIVCGWVIFFRIFLGFCDRWFLWRFPTNIMTALFGLCELTNGCAMLYKLPDEGIRFLFASGFLAFGGLCVSMQTHSVTQGLGTGYYFPGKALHGLISILFSLFMHNFIFDSKEIRSIFVLYSGVLLSIIFLTFCLHHRKKL